MSELKLINTLTESRLFRTKQNMDSLNVSDAGELAFAYLMQLNMFNKDYEFAPLAKEYATRTIAYRNFDYFRTSATDLYATIHRLMGKGIEYADPRDKIAHGRINLKKQDLLRYLQHIGAGKSDAGFEQRMLLRFQRDLNVQDGMLKSMRRLIGDWDNLNQNQKALVTTRMMQYTRAKAMRSELMPALKSFQKRGNYMYKDTKSTKSIVKSIWDKPITKVAALGGAMYAANKAGRALGKTSYQNKSDLGSRYKKS
jgi:hypothetical protein|tara:strand:+ start:830 stop:1594 length:765 start_codon:yes stop_codon:yes gene_type:complete